MPKPWVPHVVQQGDHVRKLAFRCGLDPETVWKHEKNAALADKRKNMDLLHPGDILHLPPEPPPPVDVTAGSKNRYKAKAPRVNLKLKVAVTGKDLGNKPFEVHGCGGGEPLKGTTLADGEISVDLPVWVREVTVKVPDAGLVMPMRVGDLDPIEETSGQKQRLRNLGYLPATGDIEPEQLTAALRAFQSDQKMNVSGQSDEETRAAIVKQHGL